MEDYTEPTIIKTLATILRVPIPTDGDELEAHIIELNALQYDLALELVNTQKLLYEKRKQLLWPKDKDQTELDRKTKLDADTAPIQRNYELLSRIELLIIQRLDICLQLLK